MSFSEVVQGLWVGSRPQQPKELKASFDLLVLAAEEWQPPTHKFAPILVLRAPMVDELRGMPLEDKERALGAAREVAQALTEKKRVLVTCWAGLNRSALIAALVLTRPPFNMTPRVAIARIRAVRSHHAFSNPNFESFLRDVAARTTSPELQP